MLNKYESLFFVSVLERPKSMREIGKEWGIPHANFSRYETFNKLLEKNLIKLNRIEKRESFFEIDFKNYIDFLKKNKETFLRATGGLKASDWEKIFEEIDVYTNIFEKLKSNESLRKKLYSINHIRLINPGREFWERWENALASPFIPIFAFGSLGVYFELKESIDEKTFEEDKNIIINSLAILLSVKPFEQILVVKSKEAKETINFFEYIRTVLQEIKIEDLFFLYNEIRKTKLYEHWRKVYKFDELSKYLKSISKNILNISTFLSFLTHKG